MSVRKDLSAFAKMSVRDKHRVRDMCRQVKDNDMIAERCGTTPGVVALIRFNMEKYTRPGSGRPPVNAQPRREPKHLSEDAIPLDMRWSTDAVIGSRMLLVRMLETGTHWLNRERFRAMIDELKNNVAASADPRTDIRRRINCL